MKNLMKKSLSILLCVILALSSASFAVAGELPDDAPDGIETPYDNADENGLDEPSLEAGDAEPEEQDDPDAEAPEGAEAFSGPEETEESAEGFDFPGLPAEYILSADEKALKQEVVSFGVLDSFAYTIAGEDYVDGEVLFITDSPEYAAMVAEAYGGELSVYDNEVAIITLPEGASTFDAVAAAANPGVNMPAVFPNFIYWLPEPVEEHEKASRDAGVFAYESAPKKQFWSEDFKDPLLQKPNDGTDAYQWFHDAIGSFSAWGTTMGAGVTVAVLDTGVQSNHPDLTPVLTGANTLTGTTTTATDDSTGHGTHVAGIIAARANNIGGRGVAPLASILPVKVLGDDGSGTTAGIIRGIKWVINEDGGSRRADVINMSLGGYYFDVEYMRATAEAIRSGIVIVAAAGNDGNNNRCMPADYPGVVCVASTDMAGQRSCFSNYGPQVTIAAPGSSIRSTVPTSSYGVKSGTSMATPVVAGAVALYISQMPQKPQNEKDVAAVVNALKKYATAAGSPQIGKIVNVGAMFDAATVTPTFAVYSGGSLVTDIKALIPNSCTLRITGSNFIVYTVDGSAPAIKDGLVTNGTAVKNDIANISLSSLPAGKVTVKALCVNGQGKAGKVATFSITTYGDTPGAGGMSAISGPKYLAAGKSAKYSATVLATAGSGTSKSIRWEIGEVNEVGANIKSDGTLLIPASAESGKKVVIVASSANNTTCNSVFTVTVQYLIQSVSVALPSAVTKLVVGSPAGYTESATMSLNVAFSEGGGNSTDAAAGYVTWSSSNAKVATVDAKGFVKAVGSGKVTITAKAVDGSGKSGSVAINCELPATGVMITGSTAQRTANSSLTLKAATIPAKPTTGGVVWSVNTDYGVGISTSGKLTIPSGVPVGHNISVTAASKDGYGALGTVNIAVVGSKASSVVITPSNDFGRVTYKNYNIVSAVTLFTLNPPTTTDFDVAAGDSYSAPAWTLDESKIEFTGYAGGNAVVWSSSNNSVAFVDEYGEVKAVGAGKATVTCAASDGSGKKASFTVNVLVPASSAWVQGKGALSAYSTPSLAFGKSLQMVAKLSSAYGKVSNTKVKWTVQMYRLSGSTPIRAGDLDRYASVSASGKLSINKQLLKLWDNDYPYDYFASLTATALDGSGVKGSAEVDLCPAATKIQFGKKKMDLQLGDDWYVYLYSNCYYDDFIVTSSNPKVAAVCPGGKRVSYVGYNSAMRLYQYAVLVAPLTRGKFTIKAVVNDGSGKSATAAITVK